jgi:hypothetical protein
MNAAGESMITPPSSPAALTPERTLRQLFLTLFLRGRSARGLRKERAPTSIGEKLGLMLIFYAFMGGMISLMLIFQHLPVFALAAYLHAMTFAFLGMFVAASTGEILFNKEEADILLHRPIAPRTMLWAKVRVLVEVSLWFAGAFNLVGFFAGIFATDGGWGFPFAHVASTILEAVFCTGSVVLSYQLCLRWFGRERLEGLMTTALCGWGCCRRPGLRGLTTRWRAAAESARGCSEGWPSSSRRLFCGWRLASWRVITKPACRRLTRPFRTGLHRRAAAVGLIG